MDSVGLLGFLSWKRAVTWKVPEDSSSRRGFLRKIWIYYSPFKKINLVNRFVKLIWIFQLFKRNNNIWILSKTTSSLRKLIILGLVFVKTYLLASMIALHHSVDSRMIRNSSTKSMPFFLRESLPIKYLKYLLSRLAILNTFPSSSSSFNHLCFANIRRTKQKHEERRFRGMDSNRKEMSSRWNESQSCH